MSKKEPASDKKPTKRGCPAEHRAGKHEPYQRADKSVYCRACGEEFGIPISDVWLDPFIAQLKRRV